MASSSQPHGLTEALAQMRLRLLDLTGRNRLLNYRHPIGKSLQFVQAPPAAIFDRLLEEKASIPIKALPEPGRRDLIMKTGRFTRPDVRDWATRNEIPVGFDLPAKAAGDTPELRALMYQDEVAKHCRKIEREATLAIEETGANMLYLVLGFLEYPDQRDSDRLFLAPLISIPVSILKKTNGTGVQLFSLQYNGEDIEENLSLREKLHRDHELEMPPWDEEEIDVEAYFKEIGKIVASRPNFSVKRRVSLALLSFTNMLLVRDLDPENWPTRDGRNALLDHPLVKQVFAGASDKSTESFGWAPEHNVEDPPGDNIPLVFDADSSQHSALVDVLSHQKNVVVEGPPGTGKSQTIANLIAASIAAGKRVLFVAEKLAALEVVRNRLGIAGLAPLLLELHSTKTSKKQVLESLQRRLDFRVALPRDFESKLDDLLSHRKELKRYADIMNEVVGNRLGLTVNELIWRAQRLRRQVTCGETALKGILIANAAEITAAELTFCADTLGYVASQFEEIGGFDPEQPLWGFFPRALAPGQELELQAILTNLDRVAQETEIAARAFTSFVGADVGFHFNELNAALAEFNRFASSHAPDLPYSITTEYMLDPARIAEAKQELDSIGNHAKRFRALGEDLVGGILDEELCSEQTLEDINKVEELSSALGSTAETFSATSTLVSRIGNQIEALQEAYEQCTAHCTARKLPIPATLDELARLELLARLIMEIPDDVLDLQTDRTVQPACSSSLEALKRLQQQQVELERRLSSKLYLDELPNRETLRAAILTLREGDRWFRFLQPRWRSALKTHRILQKRKERVAADQRLSELQDLADLLASREQWNANSAWREYLDIAPPTITFDLQPYLFLAQWNRDLNQLLKKLRGESSNVTELSRSSIRAWQKELKLVLLQIRSSVAAIQEMGNLLPKASADKLPIGELLARTTEWRSELGTRLDAILRSTPTGATFTHAARAQRAALERARIRAHVDGSERARRYFGREFLGIETNISRLASTLKAAEDVIQLPVPRECILRISAGNPVSNSFACRELLSHVSNGMDAISAQARQLSNWGDFALTDWLSLECSDGLRTACERFKRRTQRLLDGSNTLLPWSIYVSRRQEAIELGLTQFLDLLERRSVVAGELATIYRYCVVAEIVRTIFRNNAALRKFSGSKHQRVRDEFRRLDHELVELRGRQIAAQHVRTARPPGGYNGVRVDEKTEMVLINHLLPQQRPRIPLRKMMKNAGRAVQALKPCFMMGPQAVAQFLSPISVAFDLVIMDEASQLRPEEAIGAIARGAQVVVVGDPKQLPPTSFFTRMGQAGEDDEQFSTTDAESILDVCLSHFRPPRHLRWHYRSQHHSLIAFSNHYFYKNLVVFPSPYGHSSRLGVRATYLADAIYEDQTNLREAQRVVDAVVEHIVSRPDDSLGVVTLNLKQRDLIAELLEEKLQALKDADGYKQRWSEQSQPLFIKNLENVQGDERDAIIISTTFGRPSGADAVRQNFGPISRQGGWRRLNVLFTRAKKSVALFTSLRPEDIVIDGSTPEGTKALRNYLEYARSGLLVSDEETGLDADSDFEVAVIELLERQGYQVTPQLGVAGYRVDIAVKHPDYPGAYLAAIECDGASYHSALTVRDRDRIRQEILESMGWRGRIWRIWSTDWFRTPESESLKLMQFLDGLRRTWKPDYSAGKSWTEEGRGSSGAPTESDEAAVRNALIADDDDVLTVRIGDTVRYSDLLRPESILTACITESHTDLASGFVHRGTPLAQTLLGAAVGDEVSLHLPGAKSRTFRIVEVIR